VAEKSGDVRECARAGPRRARRAAELTGQAYGVEREERGTRGNASTTGDLGPRDRERESTRGRKTGADRSAPLGTEGGREGAREGELPLTGGVRLSDGAGARPG
jgi:hypothetical protein